MFSLNSTHYTFTMHNYKYCKLEDYIKDDILDLGPLISTFQKIIKFTDCKIRFTIDLPIKIHEFLEISEFQEISEDGLDFMRQIVMLTQMNYIIMIKNTNDNIEPGLLEIIKYMEFDKLMPKSHYFPLHDTFSINNNGSVYAVMISEKSKYNQLKYFIGENYIFSITICGSIFKIVDIPMPILVPDITPESLCNLAENYEIYFTKETIEKQKIEDIIEKCNREFR